MGIFAIQSKNTDHRAPPGVRLVLGRSNLKPTERWYAFFNRNVPNVVLRLIIMLAGVSIVSASVALTRATGLGTSPVSCFPATLSYLTPLSTGVLTFIMNVLFVFIQIALLRRNFNPVQLLQIPYVFVFSALIDVFVPVCELIPMGNYGLQVLWSIVGCLMTAFGVFLQVKASFLTLPGEGIILAISRVTKVAFPKIKVAFDSTNVVVAAIVSLACSGGLYGVREGTILAALAVGTIVGLFNKALPRFEKFCPVQGHITLTAAGMDAPGETSEPKTEGESTPLVITIGRQFGSGGREIGQAVGKELGIPVFDHTLIELTAEESGLTRSYIAAHEQEVRGGLLYNLYMQSMKDRFVSDVQEMDPIWLAQARAITKLADTGSCVIVGRCANFILKGRSNVFDVFVHAPLVPRIGRVMERENVDHMKAAETIERIDAERAEHCRRFAGKEWGSSENYQLSLDSSFQPAADNAKLIANLARKAFPNAPLTPNPEKPKAK